LECLGIIGPEHGGEQPYQKRNQAMAKGQQRSNREKKKPKQDKKKPAATASTFAPPPGKKPAGR
jgi:hypothetical protein